MKKFIVIALFIFTHAEVAFSQDVYFCKKDIYYKGREATYKIFTSGKYYSATLTDEQGNTYGNNLLLFDDNKRARLIYGGHLTAREWEQYFDVVGEIHLGNGLTVFDMEKPKKK